MVMIDCYLERENYKVLKFHANNPSYFEMGAIPVLSAAL